MRRAGLLVVLIMLVGGMLLTVNPGQLPANQPPSAEQRVQASFFSLPLSFEPCRDQIKEETKERPRGNGYIILRKKSAG